MSSARSLTSRLLLAFAVLAMAIIPADAFAKGGKGGGGGRSGGSGGKSFSTGGGKSSSGGGKSFSSKSFSSGNKSFSTGGKSKSFSGQSFSANKKGGSPSFRSSSGANAPKQFAKSNNVKSGKPDNKSWTSGNKSGSNNWNNSDYARSSGKGKNPSEQNWAGKDWKGKDWNKGDHNGWNNKKDWHNHHGHHHHDWDDDNDFFVVAPFWWPWWSVGYGGGYYGGYYGYNDPYYYDYPGYSTTAIAPEVLPAPTADAATTQSGSAYFAEAADAFRVGNYRETLRLANHAAVEAPKNALAPELMSLAAFALADYRGAAAYAQAALSLGPPADWNQLYSYYGNISAYTDQLRALEQYSKQHPDAADGHFLLGYHYLMAGHTKSAIRQLNKVISLAETNKSAEATRLSAVASDLLRQNSGDPPPTSSIP